MPVLGILNPMVTSNLNLLMGLLSNDLDRQAIVSCTLFPLLPTEQKTLHLIAIVSRESTIKKVVCDGHVYIYWSPITLPKRTSDLWNIHAFSSYRPPYHNIYNAHADLLICFIWHLLGHDIAWVSIYDICVGCTIGLEFLDVMCIYEVLYVLIHVPRMLI